METNKYVTSNQEESNYAVISNVSQETGFFRFSNQGGRLVSCLRLSMKIINDSGTRINCWSLTLTQVIVLVNINNMYENCYISNKSLIHFIFSSFSYVLRYMTVCIFISVLAILQLETKTGKKIIMFVVKYYMFYFKYS